MFDNNDFEHISKMQNEMADGIIDGSDTHEMLEKVTEIISNTNFLSDEARMAMMMEIINLCYEEEDDEVILVEDFVFSVILALCFNYSNIMTNLTIDGFDMNAYFNFLKTEVLPTMKEESKNLPYWELNDE